MHRSVIATRIRPRSAVCRPTQPGPRRDQPAPLPPRVRARPARGDRADVLARGGPGRGRARFDDRDVRRRAGDRRRAPDRRACARPRAGKQRRQRGRRPGHRALQDDPRGGGLRAAVRRRGRRRERLASQRPAHPAGRRRPDDRGDRRRARLARRPGRRLERRCDRRPDRARELARRRTTDDLRPRLDQRRRHRCHRDQGGARCTAGPRHGRCRDRDLAAGLGRPGAALRDRQLDRGVERLGSARAHRRARGRRADALPGGWAVRVHPARPAGDPLRARRAGAADRRRFRRDRDLLGRRASARGLRGRRRGSLGRDRRRVRARGPVDGRRDRPPGRRPRARAEHPRRARRQPRPRLGPVAARADADPARRGGCRRRVCARRARPGLCRRGLAWAAGRSLPFVGAFVVLYALALVGAVPRPAFPFDPGLYQFGARAAIALAAMLVAAAASAYLLRSLRVGGATARGAAVGGLGAVSVGACSASGSRTRTWRCCSLRPLISGCSPRLEGGPAAPPS